jgi:MoaA/NifB/PqqE/SkfB family radical SAM enzyme
MIELTGLHVLLTYRCTFECDHCFVWGSPNQAGTFTLADIERA